MKQMLQFFMVFTKAACIFCASVLLCLEDTPILFFRSK